MLRGAVWMLGQEPGIADVFVSFVPKESEDECEIRGEALQHVPQQSRPVVLAAVRCDGTSLQHAEPLFKGDRMVVLTAVEQCGSALEWASKQVKGDREVVLAAVEQNWRALELHDVSKSRRRGGEGLVAAWAIDCNTVNSHDGIEKANPSGPGWAAYTHGRDGRAEQRDTDLSEPWRRAAVVEGPLDGEGVPCRLRVRQTGFARRL